MPGGACWLACTALGGVSAVEFLEPDDSAQRPQSRPQSPNSRKPSFLCLGDLWHHSNLKAKMTRTAEVNLGHVPLSAAALGTRRPSAAIIAAPPSSPHRTDCPRVPRAAGRRRCRPSNMHRCTRRKRAVDWPRCQGVTRSTSVCCSLQMGCLAFSPPAFWWLRLPATQTKRTKALAMAR